MANIVSTDDGSDERAVESNNPADNTTEFANPNLDIQQTTEQSRRDDLPGTEKPDGTVNWLSGSFSGVDIKVIAHLYGQLEEDESLEQMKQDQATDQQIADGAQSAANALTIVSAAFYLQQGGVDKFMLSTGLSNGEDSQRAAKTIRTQFIGTPRGGGISVFENTLRNRLNDLVYNFKLSADSMQSKIAAREEIRKKSTATLTLATLQTLSIQTHREKMAVRALGNSYVKGYTRGPRTIAGSMIFTMFNEHALASLIRGMGGKSSVYGEGRGDTDTKTLILDQLPPLDLTIVIANEYGMLSQMGIYGVEFVNDGMTMSIEDILTEEVCQFVARDCDVLTSRGNVRLMGQQRGMHYNDNGQELSASSLLISGKDAYDEYLEKLKIRRRLSNR